MMARFVRSEKRRYYGLPTPLALPFELHTHIRACLSRLSCVTTFRIATASDVTPAATARLSGLSTVLFRFAILGTWGRLSSRSCVALSALPTSPITRGFPDAPPKKKGAFCGRRGAAPRLRRFLAERPHGRPSVRAVMRLFRFRIVTAPLAAGPSVRLSCVFSALPQVGCCAPSRGKPGQGAAQRVRSAA